jgi:hypothetical protein
MRCCSTDPEATAQPAVKYAAERDHRTHLGGFMRATLAASRKFTAGMPGRSDCSTTRPVLATVPVCRQCEIRDLLCIQVALV